MRTYEGSIEAVLSSGEYDSGDEVVVKYDELFDLAEQCKLIMYELSFTDVKDAIIGMTEQKSNRPLHPCLGGESPFDEFGLFRRYLRVDSEITAV